MLLCACATPVANKPAITVDTSSKPSEPAAAVISTTENSFKNQQVIMPDESIEKDKLAISYSIKTIAGENAPLLRLSVTFRNLKIKNISLHPKITLSDAKGNHFKAYSKKGFIKQATNLSKVATPNTADEKIKWANTYWLKENFTIPANGIEIGELIFQCKTACQPKRLTIRSGKQEFVFNISETTVVASNKNI